MQIWEGPCLYELTRQRRREREAKRIADLPPTIRYSAHAAQRAMIAEGMTTEPQPPMTGLVRILHRWQRGKCYMCKNAMRRATREHVTPRARGGKNAGNIMLACSPCNNDKGEREPNADELEMLAAFNLWFTENNR